MKRWRPENPALSAEPVAAMTLQVGRMGLIPYRRAYDYQLQLVEKLHRNRDEDDICLILQHPPVFTLGRNGSASHITVSNDFLEAREIETVRIERGGEVTYHGPGQIVCYPIINLRRNKLSVIQFIHHLEQIMLAVLCRFGLEAGRDQRNHGVWIGDQKIGSVGIAVRHGISYHGLALNVNPDLGPFNWINPCGLSGISMTSMEQELQQSLKIEDVKNVMEEELARLFGCQLKRLDCQAGHWSPKIDRKRLGKPKWLKQRLPIGSGYEKTRKLVKTEGLHTVCQEARCPNQFECFGRGTATFLLMGERCTRNCRFCAVTHAGTRPLDPDEPVKIARTVRAMGLTYVVLTSVTRDDLPDGGAGHFARTIDAIRKLCPGTLVEVLIPDLQGNKDALEVLCQHTPPVLNHNIETVAGLYPEVRPQAYYGRSLELLNNVKVINPNIITKSGLMLGLGETRQEIEKTMADIRETGCELLTLGQYLQPTAAHLAVHRYVPPEEFDTFRDTALKIGFSAVAAGPHVRSSYQAEKLYRIAS